MDRPRLGKGGSGSSSEEERHLAILAAPPATEPMKGASNDALSALDPLPPAVPPADRPPSASEVNLALETLKSLGAAHVEERLFLQRLRLVKLAMLCVKTRIQAKGGNGSQTDRMTASNVKGASVNAKEAGSRGGQKGGSVAPTTPSLGAVLAAWKLLRSDNPKAQAAALEVVESALDGPLAALIMPLLDGSPIEKQLRIGEVTFPTELSLPSERAPPPWLRSWLAGDPLGAAMGELCSVLAAATGNWDAPAKAGGRDSRVRRCSDDGTGGGIGHAKSSTSLDSLPSLPRSPSMGACCTSPATRAGASCACLSSASSAATSPSAAVSPTPTPAPTISDGLIANCILLRNAPLFRHMLTRHVASVALRVQRRSVAAGERFCRPGEAYVLVEGSVHKPSSSSSKTYRCGSMLQQLGCVYDRLPPMDLVAGDPLEGGDGGGRKGGGALLLVIMHADVWDIIMNSPPRFGLSLLKGLVRLGQPSDAPSPPPAEALHAAARQRAQEAHAQAATAAASPNESPQPPARFGMGSESGAQHGASPLSLAAGGVAHAPTRDSLACQLGAPPISSCGSMTKGPQTSDGDEASDGAADAAAAEIVEGALSDAEAHDAARLVKEADAAADAEALSAREGLASLGTGSMMEEDGEEDEEDEGEEVGEEQRALSDTSSERGDPQSADADGAADLAPHSPSVRLRRGRSLQLGMARSFSLVERALILREVQVLRFVDTEYALPAPRPHVPTPRPRPMSPPHVPAPRPRPTFSPHSPAPHPRPASPRHPCAPRFPRGLRFTPCCPPKTTRPAPCLSLQRHRDPRAFQALTPEFVCVRLRAVPLHWQVPPVPRRDLLGAHGAARRPRM